MEPVPSPRSPLLINRDDSALVVIDVQERLIPHIDHGKQVVWNVGRLIDGAEALSVPVFLTEQYPKGLGKTVEAIDEKLNGLDASHRGEKTMFSCRECEHLLQSFATRGISNLLLAGIEAHVCVAQTAMDYMAAGFNVYLAVDAIGARYELDRQIALRRLESSGATLTTVEAALFEWCERAGSSEFKTISKLVQETGPSENAIGF